MDDRDGRLGRVPLGLWRALGLAASTVPRSARYTSRWASKNDFVLSLASAPRKSHAAGENPGEGGHRRRVFGLVGGNVETEVWAWSSTAAHDRDRVVGMAAHSRNRRPAGANDSARRASTSSSSRSSGSLTSSAPVLRSHEAKKEPFTRRQGRPRHRRARDAWAFGEKRFGKIPEPCFVSGEVGHRRSSAGWGVGRDSGSSRRGVHLRRGPRVRGARAADAWPRLRAGGGRSRR